jgi:type I restriction enzyme R subunit
MSDIGKAERVTQDQVIALVRDELYYSYLGDWTDRAENSNIEESLLSDWLTKRGKSPAEITKALYQLRTEANNPTRSLYTNNQEVYKLLRFGVPVKTDVGERYEPIELIDWKHAEENHFAIAEEVTLKGNSERRPDLVFYVNGIAFGVLELKKSTVDIGYGIRQNISNQGKRFNEMFFSTIQIVAAGNDTAGLRFGTIKTEETYFLTWKEDESDNTRNKLDKYLLKLFEKERILELMYDFILFDGGIKKLPRPHQYFGVKAAQKCISERQGGIIWHTQGSGKSIVMVILAKWILENLANARVVVITDRDELDKQIEMVFTAAGVEMKRTRKGHELMSQLAQPNPRLICSLVHKFGRQGVDDFEKFISELEAAPTSSVGDIFVFVDECHRTQSGKLHRVMKASMPDAVFIGFTGTPLLKKDAKTSLEVFGTYIHTYKFGEAVTDKIVLDLTYESRDIDQRLGSKEQIDGWFDENTKDLNAWQQDELKKHWGTKQNVLSSASRMGRVVDDIVYDFKKKRLLGEGHGNAILVASSIYEACKYFEMFQKTSLKDRCALVTSYNPQTKDITLEDTGANTETDKQFIYNTYTDFLKNVSARPLKTKTETYEDDAKDKFKHEPANMRLLIVVNKLLTGFDAPPCTFLYLDKAMQDHGLFQAICRTNRLNGEEKDFGYIVDYKQQFKKVGRALAVYTSELDQSSGGEASEVILQERLTKNRETLENSLEALLLVCEPVSEPKGETENIAYFVGNSEIATDREERKPRRVALYMAMVAFMRALADLDDEMISAGFTDAEIAHFKAQQTHFLNLRNTIRQAAGEVLDMKPYEADMRYLIDKYIEADTAKRMSDFNSVGLLDLIAQIGVEDAIKMQLSGMKTQNAIAETIQNNVRKKIVESSLADPAFYQKMSAVLDEIILARKAQAIEYEEYLRRIDALVKKLQGGHADGTPKSLDTPAKRALWNNLGQNEDLALKVDSTVLEVRPDGWRGVRPKENAIKQALLKLLGDIAEVERVFLIVKAQGEY